jgi:nucleotide-binding universal stress UspA family protein
MYAKILVPVDGSEASTRALSEAMNIAKEHSSRLRLLHVVKTPIVDYGYSAADSSWQDIVAKLCVIGRSLLNKAEMAGRAQGLNPECALFESLDGTAAHVIIQQAKEWAADLIVMGIHPREASIGVGSDTAAVISESPVPVLSVRDTTPSTAIRSHRSLDYASGFRPNAASNGGEAASPSRR